MRKRLLCAGLVLALAFFAGHAAFAQAGASSPGLSSGGRIVSIERVGLFERESIRDTLPKFFESYGPPRVDYAVAKYVLRFTSQDFDGSAAMITAQLYVPVTAEGKERPVYVFASGTTGIGDNCAPSLETPDTKRWGWYEQKMLA